MPFLQVVITTMNFFPFLVLLIHVLNIFGCKQVTKRHSDDLVELIENGKVQVYDTRQNETQEIYGTLQNSIQISWEELTKNLTGPFIVLTDDLNHPQCSYPHVQCTDSSIMDNLNMSLIQFSKAVTFQSLSFLLEEKR